MFGFNLKHLFGKLGSLMKWMLTFNGSTAFGELSEPVVFVGDFEIEIEFSTTENSNFNEVLSSVGGELAYTDITTGVFVYKYSVSSSLFSASCTTNLTDGGLHHARISYIGTTLNIFIDGILEKEVTSVILDPAEFSLVSSGSYFSGIIKSIKFTDNATEAQLWQKETLADMLDQTPETYEQDMLTFDGATSYGELSTPWVSTDSNWTAEIVFEGMPGNAERLVLDGHQSDDRVWIYVDEVNNIDWNPVTTNGIDYDGVFYPTTSTIPFPVDSKLHTIKLHGNAIGSVGNIAGRYLHESNKFYNGIIKSIILTDLTTPANSRTYTLDSGSDEYELPDGEVEGSELVVNGGFDTDSGWIKETGWSIADSVVSSLGHIGHSFVYQDYQFILGKSYLVEYDITARTAGNVTVSLYGNGNTAGGISTNVGSYSYILTALENHTSLRLRNNDGLFVGSVDNISVKELPLALIYNNVVTTDWAQYGISPDSRNYSLDSQSTEYELPDGVGFGSEKVVNGTFDTDTDGWSIAAGNGTIAVVSEELEGTSGTTGILINQTITNLAIGTLYLLSAKCRQGTFAAVLQVGISDSPNSTPSPRVEFSTTTNETKHTTFTATATTMYYIIRFSTVGDGLTAYFDDLSLRELPLALIYNNVVEGDWSQYTFDASLGDNGGWVSNTELVVNGGFDTDSVWEKDTGWTISNGIAVGDGVNYNGADLWQDVNDSVAGVTYVCSFYIAAGSVASVNVYVGGVFTGTVSGVGAHVSIATAINPDTIRIRINAAFGVDIDNVSVKEVILL